MSYHLDLRNLSEKEIEHMIQEAIEGNDPYLLAELLLSALVRIGTLEHEVLYLKMYHEPIQKEE